ncbi:toxin HicA [Candidatus Gastranaerophilus sp. (ex Termes propinquus)]|nr:toxin HicA [Candidatus Gastranaerophilus sp. (ex Termes propinquus)]
MSKIEKLLQKFLNNPKDLEWREFVKILSHFGFEQMPCGVSGGSRRTFENQDGVKLYFHEPHPSKIVKSYALRSVIEVLKKEGIL